MSYCITLSELTGPKLSTLANTGYLFHGVYLNNARVVFKADGITVNYTLDSTGKQDISMRDLVKIYMYIDAGLQPSGSSGTTPASYTIMPGWTQATHPMTGLMYAIVKVTYNQSKGVNGLPDCLFHVSSNMTLPGDVLYDYMTNSRYGANIAVAQLDTSLAELNTFASTGFSYKTSTGATSTSVIGINGLVDTTNTVLSTIEDIATAASSWITFDSHSGKWRVIINQAGTSIATLTDSSIQGEITVSGTSLTQLNNIVDVKYQNTDILDKVDFVKMQIPSGNLFANEPLTSMQMTLPYTNKQAVAMKIGLQNLKQARLDKIISFTTDYSYINLRAGDIIDVTSAVYGFTNKKFRLITVEEEESVDGNILVHFTALEYDSAVYTYDITELSITTDDGILGIGSIGKPNTPTVTKTEQANVPKIVINAVIPSGIVYNMEFWITFDTSIQNDTARTYIQIGTYTAGNGALLNENDNISYTYSQLSQSNFYVKVRGTNNMTTGPYSDPSGLVAYTPAVVADQLTDAPMIIGGIAMGIGALQLLSNLDKLFSGVTSVGSLFDKIFSLFTDETGVDLIGQAVGGTLTGAPGPAGPAGPAVSVKDEGTQITSGASSINFVGSGVVATANGSAVTVTIDTSTTPNDVGHMYYICSTNGLIGIGDSSAIANSPTSTAYPFNCSSHGTYTLYRNNYNTSVTALPTKSGTTVTYNIGYVQNSGYNLAVPGGNVKVTGMVPSSYNGSYKVQSYTSTSVIVKYPTAPAGTITSWSSAKVQYEYYDTYGDIITPTFTPVAITPNTSLSHQVSILPSHGIMYDYDWIYKTPTYNTPTLISSNIATGSDASGLNNGTPYATSSVPIVFSGDDQQANNGLYNFTRWWNLKMTTFPSAGSTVSYTVTVTANGLTDTQTVIYDYVDYFTVYPNQPKFWI